jgi:hypothetical protein
MSAFIIRCSVAFLTRRIHAAEDFCWSCMKHKRVCDCGRLR